jgi:hypothetical protein
MLDAGDLRQRQRHRARPHEATDVTQSANYVVRQQMRWLHATRELATHHRPWLPEPGAGHRSAIRGSNEMSRFVGGPAHHRTPLPSTAAGQRGPRTGPARTECHHCWCHRRRSHRLCHPFLGPPATPQRAGGSPRAAVAGASAPARASAWAWVPRAKTPEQLCFSPLPVRCRSAFGTPSERPRSRTSRVRGGVS